MKHRRQKLRNKPMKNKLIKSAVSLMLIAVLAVSIVGCGCSKISEDEAYTVLKDLIERSYVLNVIYYGEGLKYRDSGNPNDEYGMVLETESYILRSSLEKETREVFTQTYADSIINMAFLGVQSAINQNSVMPRYVTMGDDDLIYVNKNYKPVVQEIAQYDYKTLKITKISRRFIEAEIKTTKGINVDVVLVNENGAWRLDSGTY